ncbi:MAG TPA: hypothetical protein VI997_09160 [Candidatus Thermoplasmatota archaeon]|nr:hypothetical protein [Candidatus Thermoplasmatota archaeon]
MVAREALLLSLVLAAAAPALAQTHEHSGEAMPHVLFDLEPSGRAVVGEVSHFGFVLLNAAGYPQVHQDATFSLLQDGSILFESASTHEYDGIFSFDYVFTEAGPYVVQAEWKDQVATFQGDAVQPTSTVRDARLDLVAPADAVAGEPVAFDLGVVDGAGALVPHSDVVVEAWRGFDLVLRTHLHTHEDRMSFQYAFPSAGTYTMRFTSYLAFPSEGVADLDAFVTTHEVAVAPGKPVVPTIGSTTTCAKDPLAAPEPPLAPRAREADPGHAHDNESAPPTFNLTIDPSALIGPATQVRIAGIVQDAATRVPVQHVNFKTEILGPTGVVFASESLHEYDGVFEIAIRPEVVGSYAMELTTTAKRYGLDATGMQMFCVGPPVIPLAAGPMMVMVDGPEAPVAGEPAEFTFAIQNALGVPLAHAEIDLTLVRKTDGLPILTGKVHSHNDGKMHATIAFPQEGEYDLIASPYPLNPTPTLLTGASFAFSVAPGAEEAVPVLTAGPTTVSVPAPGLVPLVLGVALLAWIIARRRR